MPIDLNAFGDKLRRYREQRQLTLEELVPDTGIAIERLKGFETGATPPTGDEVLILADFFQCDYRFFVSNEKLAAFEQTESLYRRFGIEFSKKDRRSIQEFFLLCECEAFLMAELKRELGAQLVQSTPHLFAWLYFNSHMSDSDKDQIAADLKSFGRSLQPHLDEYHTEAQRCRALANQANRT